MGTAHVQAVEVFCSYSHEDEILWRGLEKQLYFLKRQGLISAWHHYSVQAGQEWKLSVEQHLNKAQIILLLISPDFIASDQCYNIEMPHAMKRHEAGEAQVIPIILRPVFWRDQPFSKLQVLPTKGKPVKSWLDIDEAFLDIAVSIQQIVKELLIEQLLTEAERLDNSKRHEEALVTCEQVIRLSFSSASASAYCMKGDILLRCQRYEDALCAYQEAVLLNPDITDPYFYQNKGHALSNLNRYEEALASYQKAISLSMPNPDPRLYYDQSIVLERLARRAYEMAEQLSQRDSHGTVI